jgi:hypothetical protein
MSKYHINPRTGNPGICRAIKVCPFGDLEKAHYSSKEEAREAYETEMKLDMLVASTVSKADLNWKSHPCNDDYDLQALLISDWDLPIESFAFRALEIPLEELRGWISDPESYLMDGNEDQYNQVVGMADDYENGEELPPTTVSRPPWSGGRWQVSDGLHRLNAASLAKVKTLQALEAYPKVEDLS